MRPRSASRGAWRVALAKRLLPRPPAPPRGHDGALARRHEVEAGAVEAVDLRARGHAHDLLGPVGAVALGALAVAAAAGLDVHVLAEALQVAQRVVADHDHVAAAAAVAAVGSALGDVGLAPEADAAVAAAPGAHVDLRPIVHALIVKGADLADAPVFLITGASSGIGAATARSAAEAGYRLVLSARSADRLQDLAAELGGDDRALAVTCDVGEWDQQERMVATTMDKFGRIDVVFANAGFGARRGFTEETPEFWRSMVLTNVLGAAYTIRATINPLRKSKGHLILTSSVAGRRALEGSFYSATKHAVTAMGEAVRQELNESGVRMTADRAGDGRHPVLRQRRARVGAQARGRGPGDHVRRVPTRPRRRQRGADPAGGPAELGGRAASAADQSATPSGPARP